MAHLTPEPEKVVFTSEVAGTSPTRAEIDAGTVLDDAEISGWTKAANLIDVSDGSSRQGKTTPGTQRRLGDPKVTYSGDQVLAEGTPGFLLVLRNGDVPGSVLEKRPVIVALNDRPQRQTGGATRRTVTFAEADEPAYCVVPPADGAGS